MKTKKTAKLITINPVEVRLKRRVREHLRSLGFERDANGALRAPSGGKDVIRQMHKPQRKLVVQAASNLIQAKLSNLNKFFANGSEVDVASISPRLERVYSSTWQSDLFKLASLTWSVPVSSGYGRRLRFLVWDDSNGKLIGILAIGDPVFNLSARDGFIGWSGEDRKQRLVNIMDAYVLGAVPPYNLLLGGKLIACLLRSLEIYQEFQRVYGNSAGLISGENKGARLLAVTTSSSMGRSAVYNRLKLGNVQYLKSLGFTGGWGHFHIPDPLFNDLRTYLRTNGYAEADLHQFGQGPNWRIRMIRSALGALGFKGDMLKHGIQREALISFLADNSAEILRTGEGKPQLDTLLPVTEISGLAIDRWIEKRADSRPEYRDWRSQDIGMLIKTGSIGDVQPMTEVEAGTN